jgi:hypothetical protein
MTCRPARVRVSTGRHPAAHCPEIKVVPGAENGPCNWPVGFKGVFAFGKNSPRPAEIVTLAPDSIGYSVKGDKSNKNLKTSLRAIVCGEIIELIPVLFRYVSSLVLPVPFWKSSSPL